VFVIRWTAENHEIRLGVFDRDFSGVALECNPYTMHEFGLVLKKKFPTYGVCDL